METPSSFGRSGAATGHPLVATILLGTLFVMSGFIVAGPATATTVGTGYTAADLIDVQRAVDHLSFDGPAELQKVGVMVVDFILTISDREEPECDLDYGSQIDPYGTYRYASTWRGSEPAALDRVADHYCISWEQAQMFGAVVLTFLVGLDVEANGPAAGQGSADTLPDPADVDPVRLSGSGSRVELLPGPPPSDYQVLSYSHAGGGVFRVIGLDVAGNEIEVVVAEVVSSGRVVVEEPESFAAVRVVADGDWTLDFEPLTGLAEFSGAGPVAGVGNDVLLVPAGTGVARPRFRHLDEGTFSVRFRGVDGVVTDFLEEVAGPLVSRFELPSGARILEVRATGEWALVHGDTLPPGRPTGFTVMSGDSSAEVSWSTPVSGGSPITGYDVEHRRVPTGNGEDLWLVEVVSTGRSVRLSDLANGAAHQIRVRGFNAEGPGLWTEIATATPTPEVRNVEVVGLEGTAGDRSVDLAWEAPVGVGVVSYTVVYFDESRLSDGVGAIRGGTGRRTGVDGPPRSVQAGLDRTGGLRQPLIVGGTKWAEEGRGYVVGLLDAANPDAFQAHYCGGTLVAPRWVVTAAHCVADKAIDEVDVIVGVVDLDAVDVDDRMNLAAIHVHEHYDSERILHDIAVIELVEDGMGNPIPWQDDGALPMEGTALEISGWGAVMADGSVYETVLRSSTGRVLAGPDDDSCGSWQGFLSTDELCIGSETGVGACVGDSGGPVVAELGMTRLVGITSYGLSGACSDPTYPNVATRVSGKSRWIEARVGDPWQEVVGIGVESYTIEGLVNGRKYTFNVTAVDEMGRSISPMTVAVTPVGPPAAPTGLTGTGGDLLAMMEWTAAFAAEEHPVIGYVVEYSSSDGATWMVANGGVIDSTIATVSDLVNETTVEVRVRAVNDLGIGPASGVVSVTIGRPEAPTGLTGRVGDGLVVLDWTAPASDGGLMVLDYVVDLEQDDGTWLPVDDGSSSATGATVTGLDNGTPVRLRVAAVTAVGRGPASMTVVIVPGRPDAPTDLQAVSADGSLVLTWNPSAWDGGSPVTNHLIEVSSDGGMSWKVAGGDVGRGTTATVSDLENGTTYLLRVRAVSGLGSSRATSVQAGPATVPGTPTDIMAVGGEGLLTLSWIRPADGGRAITGIWVELAPADDGGWQSFVAGPLTTSARIGGLVPGREYRVRVSYGNEIGTGSVSGEVRVLVR